MTPEHAHTQDIASQLAIDKEGLEDDLVTLKGRLDESLAEQVALAKQVQQLTVERDCAIMERDVRFTREQVKPLISALEFAGHHGHTPDPCRYCELVDAALAHAAAIGLVEGGEK